MMNDMNNIQYPVPKQEYKVLVRCATYNQSKYIEDALNGFAMQQTNFPFVCLVMDDASTDGEQDVIKEWMERECDMSRAETIDIPSSVVIIVPHKTNESCTFAFYLLKQNLYKVQKEKMRHVTPWREKCEYEALCEGDDYWIDPSKLQKQVDFMERNPDYGLCYGKASVYIQASGKYGPIMGKKGESFNEILLYNYIPTLTTLYRTSLYKDYIRDILPFEKNWMKGDYPLWLYISTKAKVHFFDEVMCTYRQLSDSASHGDYRFMIKFVQDTYDIALFFYNKYHPTIEIQTIHDTFNRYLLFHSFRNRDKRSVKLYYQKIQTKQFKDYIKMLLSIFF